MIETFAGGVPTPVVACERRAAEHERSPDPAGSERGLRELRGRAGAAARPHPERRNRVHACADRRRDGAAWDRARSGPRHADGAHAGRGESDLRRRDRRGGPSRLRRRRRGAQEGDDRRGGASSSSRRAARSRSTRSRSRSAQAGMAPRRSTSRASGSTCFGAGRWSSSHRRPTRRSYYAGRARRLDWDAAYDRRESRGSTARACTRRR